MATWKHRTLTLERLREVLSYNPETGEWKWIKRGHGRRLNGVAGCIKTGKYNRLEITIDKKIYVAHILAFFYMTGEWPSTLVDHIDTNPFNNRWNNLRLATQEQNRQNHRDHGNQSGLVGAFWNRFRNCWVSSIRDKYLGTFETAQQAHEAYKKAALEQYGEFAHHSLKRESLKNTT